jgi:hypothetical protein
MNYEEIRRVWCAIRRTSLSPRYRFGVESHDVHPSFFVFLFLLFISHAYLYGLPMEKWRAPGISEADSFYSKLFF